MRTLLMLSLSCAALVAGAMAMPLAAAAPPAPARQATVDALAGRYNFGAAEAPLTRCAVRLGAKPVRGAGRVGLPVTINAKCRWSFPALRLVSRWEPAGGASLHLLGGRPLHELSDFSPVQDGSGVYLRGGFAGDRKVYELRPQH